MRNQISIRHGAIIVFLMMIVIETGGCSTAKSTPAVMTDAESIREPAIGDTSVRQADDMVLVYVPAGTLLMGSDELQLKYARELCLEYPDAYGKCSVETFELEKPQRPVEVNAFWIDQNEVTVSQYDLCVEDGMCRPSRLAEDSNYSADDFPVAGIPWSDAGDYCGWAGGRLPVEAEWEYAARGSSGLIYPWRDEFDCQRGNFWEDCTPCEDGYPGPAPVGSFAPGASWSGALDMAGNVWEWVADEYDASSLPNGLVTNIKIPTKARVLRGGSWGYCPAFVRSSYRYVVEPEADYLAVGFRCVVPIGE
jgi:formylglycine-generating enzyme required for sulfatase activity